MRRRAGKTQGIGERDLTRGLDRLCRLASDIASLRSEDETLKKIVDTAVGVIGVPAVHLALVDSTREGLYGVISSGRHRPEAPRARFVLRPGMAAHAALALGRAILVRNAARDRRVIPEARVLLGIGAAAYIPLLGGGETFGLLILTTPRPHDWTTRETKLASYVASVASVALQTFRLLNRLAETDGRLRSLIEDLPAVVYTCEVDFPYRAYFVGPQGADILGYTAREWIEDPDLFLKLVHPDDLQPLIQVAEEAKRGRGFVRTEYRMLDRRGNTRWFRDEAVLVRDLAGQPVAWHGVLMEVTSIKEIDAVAPPIPAPGPPQIPPPASGRASS